MCAPICAYQLICVRWQQCMCMCTYGVDSQEEDISVQFYHQWDVVESCNQAVTRGGIHTYICIPE